MIFKKSVLKYLIGFHSSEMSAHGYEISVTIHEEIQEIRRALANPPPFKCYKSRGMCCYSISPYHMKKCPGINRCLVARGEKKKKQEIKFQ